MSDLAAQDSDGAPTDPASSSALSQDSGQPRDILPPPPPVEPPQSPGSPKPDASAVDHKVKTTAELEAIRTSLRHRDSVSEIIQDFSRRGIGRVKLDGVEVDAFVRRMQKEGKLPEGQEAYDTALEALSQEGTETGNDEEGELSNTGNNDNVGAEDEDHVGGSSSPVSYYTKAMAEGIVQHYNQKMKMSEGRMETSSSSPDVITPAAQYLNSDIKDDEESTNIRSGEDTKSSSSSSMHQNKKSSPASVTSVDKEALAVHPGYDIDDKPIPQAQAAAAYKELEDGQQGTQRIPIPTGVASYSAPSASTPITGASDVARVRAGSDEEDDDAALIAAAREAAYQDLEQGKREKQAEAPPNVIEDATNVEQDNSNDETQEELGYRLIDARNKRIAIEKKLGANEADGDGASSMVDEAAATAATVQSAQATDENDIEGQSPAPASSNAPSVQSAQSGGGEPAGEPVDKDEEEEEEEGQSGESVENIAANDKDIESQSGETPEKVAPHTTTDSDEQEQEDNGIKPWWKRYLCCLLVFIVLLLCLAIAVPVGLSSRSSDNNDSNAVVLTTMEPSESQAPSMVPSLQPSMSAVPSTVPSVSLKPSQSSVPSSQPSSQPSSSDAPSEEPSQLPSSLPSEMPSAVPSSKPSSIPSGAPTTSLQPTISPSFSTSPSSIPSLHPSPQPSVSISPSSVPSLPPTPQPSVSLAPSKSPTQTPSLLPSHTPSESPTFTPSLSSSPSFKPTTQPTMFVTERPSLQPSFAPTKSHQPSTSLVPTSYWSSLAFTQLGDSIEGLSSRDRFGAALSFSSDSNLLAIGALQYSGRGYVNVYRFDTNTTIFKQLGESINGGESGDNFGTSVLFSRNANLLAIGAVQNGGGGPGYVNVYTFDEEKSTFTQLGDTLVGDTNGDQFGISLSFSPEANLLAVGAVQGGNNGPGYVNVYRLDENTSTFVKLGETLIGSGDDDWFGNSLDFSFKSNMLAVGASQVVNNGPGYANVYKVDQATSSFTQLGDSIKGFNARDRFGYSLTFSPNVNVLAIGAYQSYITDPGYVNVYRFDDIKMTFALVGDPIEGERSGDNFGTSLSFSLDTNLLAIGAVQANIGGPGYVNVYNIDEQTYTIAQFGKSLVGSNYEDEFGTDVSFSPNFNQLAIGAAQFVTSGAGYANVYHLE